MVGIIVSIVIGVLLGYIGANEYSGLVWIIFSLMAIMIIVNNKKLDITAFITIILSGVGLIVTQHLSPRVYGIITTYVVKYTDLVITFVRDIFS